MTSEPEKYDSGAFPELYLSDPKKLESRLAKEITCFENISHYTIKEILDELEFRVSQHTELLEERSLKGPLLKQTSLSRPGNTITIKDLYSIFGPLSETWPLRIYAYKMVMEHIESKEIPLDDMDKNRIRCIFFTTLQLACQYLPDFYAKNLMLREIARSLVHELDLYNISPFPCGNSDRGFFEGVNSIIWESVKSESKTINTGKLKCVKVVTWRDGSTEHRHLPRNLFEVYLKERFVGKKLTELRRNESERLLLNFMDSISKGLGVDVICIDKSANEHTPQNYFSQTAKYYNDYNGKTTMVLDKESKSPADDVVLCQDKVSMTEKSKDMFTSRKVASCKIQPAILSYVTMMIEGNDISCNESHRNFASLKSTFYDFDKEIKRAGLLNIFSNESSPTNMRLDESLSIMLVTL
ncbi:MAG: hypothetical protein HQL32_01670 [Planctomycetes bacterium]|nr:hypothetical protein [Planctomycetota bacterium]